MKKYFESKLRTIADHIEGCKNSIVRNATELDLKAIMQSVDRLRELKEDLKSFSKDAVHHLEVNEFAELYNAGIIDKHSAQYEYKYNRYVTIEEREILKKLDYSFNEARIK